MLQTDMNNARDVALVDELHNAENTLVDSK